jgi:hypothetical protein
MGSWISTQGEWSGLLSCHGMIILCFLYTYCIFSSKPVQHTIMELSSFTVRLTSCQWIHGLAHHDVHGVSGLSYHGMIIHGFFYLACPPAHYGTNQIYNLGKELSMGSRCGMAHQVHGVV